MAPRSTHRVVVIGSGFGGLFATKALKRADVEVTVIDRTTTHLFQPLLYQVATGILSEGEVAPPTRGILRRQKNATVLMGEVVDVDLEARTVTSRVLGRTTVTPYDSLVVAAGAGQSYFGNDHFSEFAPGLKTIDDALELRGRIFGAYEMAELETDHAELDAWLTFVVVGAGPTGVEMAGQIAELSRRTLSKDFRNIDPSTTRVVLVDAADEVLGAFGGDLSAGAERELKRLGVEVQLGAKVVDVDATGIEVEDSTGQRRRIVARTKVWAAGVAAAPLSRLLAEKAGAETDRAGRIKVLPDLTVPGHPEVFCLGDMAFTGNPGVAQVALQGGKYAAKTIALRTKGRTQPKPFHYFDKGSMAVIARARAVAQVGPLRFSGFLAWLMWLVIHLVYLTAFKSRVTALLHWAVSFIGRGRSERVATIQQVVARTRLQGIEGPGLPALTGVGRATGDGGTDDSARITWP
ncbi:MAG: FAD-dependent pyridine nucleotide-disulfide oxidoreductase [Frankiales bacterium]|nr:FAD-dependent pyridine nucleotide-disulfide oxidoreductase [Frankiales bacterium]